MTKEREVNLRDLESFATAAPWDSASPPTERAVWSLAEGVRVAVLPGGNGEADAALIAATRNALSYLLDVVEAARDLVDYLKEDAESWSPDQQDALLDKQREALAALDAHLQGTEPHE